MVLIIMVALLQQIQHEPYGNYRTMINNCMEWKTIKESDTYEISSTGLLRNKKRGTVKPLAYDHEGYIRYQLTINGKRKNRFAHRLVAEAFIPNPDDLPIVHHMDNVRDNNNVENLMWCTSKFNRQNAYVTCPCCGEKIKV